MDTSTRQATFCIALAVCGWLGCGSPPSPGDEVVSEASQAATTCDPARACCVVAFDMTDPLQVQLSAWGCSKPTVLSPNSANGKWWFWSRCVDTNKRVEAYLQAHPTYALAPYSAHATIDMTSLNMNIKDLGCTSKAPQASIDALWDPTCTTCRPQ